MRSPNVMAVSLPGHGQNSHLLELIGDRPFKSQVGSKVGEPSRGFGAVQQGFEINGDVASASSDLVEGGLSLG